MFTSLHMKFSSCLALGLMKGPGCSTSSLLLGSVIVKLSVVFFLCALISCFQMPAAVKHSLKCLFDSWEIPLVRCVCSKMLVSFALMIIGFLNLFHVK